LRLGITFSVVVVVVVVVVVEKDMEA